MTRWPHFIESRDLAPGDSTPHPALPDGIGLHIVESPADPLFATAYALLDEEFGAKGELETREVLTERMKWDPKKPTGGCRMLYHLMLLMKDGECVGLRDHTAITSDGCDAVVVHLSHVFVVPKWRRKGLAPILRTVPVITARQCAALTGKPDAPITLFCEMEPIDLSIPANKIRRTSYGQAGFRAIGAGIGYMQPDFRPPAVIDADPMGSTPIPFDILFRRIGREEETLISGCEVVTDVELIYAMYSAGFREGDMAPCLNWLRTFKTTYAPEYTLYPPTEVP
jgi:hypothetical protein